MPSPSSLLALYWALSARDRVFVPPSHPCIIVAPAQSRLRQQRDSSPCVVRGPCAQPPEGERRRRIAANVVETGAQAPRSFRELFMSTHTCQQYNVWYDRKLSPPHFLILIQLPAFVSYQHQTDAAQFAMSAAAMDVETLGSTPAGTPSLLTETGAHAGRRDGRGFGEMRELSVAQGPHKGADGSANVQVGATIVLAAIYGPMETTVSKQDADRCAVTVWVREGAETVSGTDELCNLVRASVLCALYPRKNLCVCAHILSADGGVRAAAVNASVLALINAGVPMANLPVAACVALCNSVVIADPNAVEESEADAVLTFTFSTQNGKLSTDFAAMHTTGDCGGIDIFNRAADAAHSLAEHTLAFFKLSIERNIQMPHAYK